MSQIPLFRLPGDPAPLEVGEEAWALAMRQAGEARHDLTGAIRVLVLSIVGDAYECQVLRSSGHWLVGQVVELPRRALYACNDRVEHNRFGAEFRRLWGDR